MRLKISCIGLLFLCILFTNCKTISELQTHNDNIDLIYTTKLANVSSEPENNKYIFIRLYYPIYNNPICIENTLKNLISFVDTNPIKYSHASIGFDLNDNFVGLTTAGKRDFKIEHCTEIETNPYMAKCNPEKSIQTTYAIKVTPEEFIKAKKLTELLYYENIKYSISLNFSIGFFEFKRKFFTSNNNQKFENLNSLTKNTKLNNFEESKFVCSNLVAYILVNSVDSIRSFFEEHKLDYNLIIPSDIPCFPGIIKLFSSSWKDYNKTALEFVKTENNIFNQNTESVEK